MFLYFHLLLGYDGVSTFLEDLADLIACTIGGKNGLSLPDTSSNTLQSPKSQVISNAVTNCSPLEATTNETQLPNTRSTGNRDNSNDGNGSTCQPPLVTLSMVKIVSSKCNEINNHDIDSGIDSCDEKKKTKSNIMTGTLIDQSSVQNGRGRLVRCRNVISNSTQVSL